MSLKIDSLERSIKRKEEKWGMEFSAFKRRLAEDNLPEEADSYRVEQDLWEWEEAETLKAHYRTLKAHYREVQAEWT